MKTRPINFGTAGMQMACRLFLGAVCSSTGWGSLRATAADGDKSVFVTHCAPCHGPDGRARTPAARKLGVKDLTQSRLPDAEIRRQIIEGRRDKAGKQQMPDFGDKLTGEQISALIARVKEFRK